jgi:hypothetical protein
MQTVTGYVFAKFRSTYDKNRNIKSFGMLRRDDWCRWHKILANLRIQQHPHSRSRMPRTTTRLPLDVYRSVDIVLLTFGTFKPFLTRLQQRLDKCAYQLRHVCLSGCKTSAELIFSIDGKYTTISIKIGQKCQAIMYKLLCVSARIKVEIRVLPSA